MRRQDHSSSWINTTVLQDEHLLPKKSMFAEAVVTSTNQLPYRIFEYNELIYVS